MKDFESLSVKDKNTIQALERQAYAAIEGSIAELDYLKSSLELYKQALNDNIDSCLTVANTITKYKTNNVGNMGTYNLPSVMASTVGAYDLNTMRKDNELLLKNQDALESSEQQRNMAFKMIIQNYNDLKTRLNLLANANQQIFSFIINLNNNVVGK